MATRRPVTEVPVGAVQQQEEPFLGYYYVRDRQNRNLVWVIHHRTDTEPEGWYTYAKVQVDSRKHDLETRERRLPDEYFASRTTSEEEVEQIVGLPTVKEEPAMTETTPRPIPDITIPDPVISSPPNAPRPTELKIGQPTAFSGKNADSQAFLAQCLNYLETNDRIYDTDHRKIAFILSFMTKDSAATWARDFIMKKMAKAKELESKLDYGAYWIFVNSFEKEFNPVDGEADAVRKMKLLSQYSEGSLDQYIEAFRKIKGLTGITNNVVLSDYFLNGLNYTLKKNVVATGVKLSSLDSVIETAQRLDSSYQQYFGREAKGRKGKKEEATIGKMSTETRDRLHKEGKCFRCFRKGHISRDCDTPPPKVNQIVTDQPVASTSSTTAEEKVTVARITTLMGQLSSKEKEELTKNMVDEGF